MIYDLAIAPEKPQNVVLGGGLTVHGQNRVVGLYSLVEGPD